MYTSYQFAGHWVYSSSGTVYHSVKLNLYISVFSYTPLIWVFSNKDELNRWNLPSSISLFCYNFSKIFQLRCTLNCGNLVFNFQICFLFPFSFPSYKQHLMFASPMNYVLLSLRILSFSLKFILPSASLHFVCFSFAFIIQIGSKLGKNGFILAYIS